MTAHQWTPVTRSTGLIVLILILLPFLFFWPVITPNSSDQQFIKTGDFTEQYFPLRATSARAWTQGQVPLWNRYIFGGQPALADIQIGGLYPPHILQAWLWGWIGQGFPLRALEWQVIIHFSIAGLGMFWLGYVLGQALHLPHHSKQLMGVVTALIFTYSGYLTGFPVQQVSIVQVSAWLPWVLVCLQLTLNALQQQRYRIAIGWGSGGGVAFALAILAGHPQTVMYIAYLALAYSIFQAAMFWHNHPTQPFRFRLRQSVLLATAGLASMALGGLIALAQLWPTLVFISRSLRQRLDFDEVARGLPLTEIVTLLYPGYFGGSPAYVGIMALVLIAVAVMLRSHILGLGKQIWFWTGAAIVSLLIAFGSGTFLYPLLYLLLPGLASVRQQERILLVFSFAAAILAAYGAALLSVGLTRPARQTLAQLRTYLHWTGLAGLVLTPVFVFGSTWATHTENDINLFIGVLRHHLFGLLIFGGCLLLLALRPLHIWRRSWGIWLIGTWLTFGLFTTNWQFNLEQRTSRTPFVISEAVHFLQTEADKDTHPWRIASGGLLPGGHNAGAVYGLEDITGNTPLQLADVAAFMSQIPSWRLWQLLNVRYVLDSRQLDSPGLQLRHHSDALYVYELGDPLPRSWFVYEVEVNANWSRLADEPFNLKQTAILEHNLPADLPAEAPPTPGTSNVTTQTENTLNLQAKTETPGLLVISQVFDHGWRAWHNGQSIPLYRVNGVLQGVLLPAGEHQVSLKYEPPGWRWGRWGSSLGIMLALIGVLIAARSRAYASA